MLTISGNKFAKNDKEFTESIFDKNGTCKGFYKKMKDKVIFSNMQHRVFAALVRNSHGVFLVNCDNYTGKYRYQFALAEEYESLFGLSGLGYSAQNERVKTLANELL